MHTEHKNNLNYNKFPCDACGACCMNIGNIAELKEFDNGNGTCIYLKENLCSIYSQRPIVCRVDEMFVKFYSFMDRQDFYTLNIDACKKIKNKEYGQK